MLVAAGREPVTGTLGLDAAGVEADARGIVCDDRLRTANKRVYAAGDIAGKGALTHLAGWHGSVILRNLYYGVPTKQSSNPIPGCVYTSPGLAQIGLTESRAREQHGDKVSVIDWPFHDNDRAIAEGDTAGAVKLVLGKGGKLLGVHVAGARADDIAALAAVTMAKGGSVRDLTSPVLAYPTRGEALKRAAGKHFEPVVFWTLREGVGRVIVCAALICIRKVGWVGQRQTDRRIAPDLARYPDEPWLSGRTPAGADHRVRAGLCHGDLLSLGGKLSQ